MADAAAKTPIERVAVVGAGTMGRQIATLAAAGGHPVAIFDAYGPALESAIPKIRE